MPTLRIDIDLDHLDAEAVEALCLELGASSITLVDQRDDAILEPAPGELRLWPATRLQALFVEHPSTDAAMASLRNTLAIRLGMPANKIGCLLLEDRVWEREWLKDFRPLQCGARLWIVPNELTAPPEAQVIVRLDPGLAFGTGTHPTTAMCLQWLDAHVAPGATLIDYGCGSGILAIAALKLGASRAHAFDIDPQALIATRDNAGQNQVANRLTICGDAAQLPSRANIVIANILAQPLIDLAPQLAARVVDGGQLILSGLLANQVEEVRNAYAPFIDLVPANFSGDWALLEGTC